MQWWCAATNAPWTWAWTPYPGVWLFIAGLATAYVLRRRGHADLRSSRRKPLYFLAGLATLWIALDWPLGPLGASYLASVHMVQFLLISLAAPPLLLVGLGDAAPGRPAGLVGTVLHALTHPLVALATFLTLVALTHWPPVVDGLMPSQWGSFALDLTWLAAGLLFWWPVVGPRPRSWFGYPLRVVYLIATTILNTGVFAYLTFSEFPLYAIYELSPPVGGLTTREDQLVAGLLMKVGAAPILWTAASVLFYRWYRAEA